MTNGQTPIKLPKKLTRGDRSMINWCNSARLALQQLRDREPRRTHKKQPRKDTLPPFWPELEIVAGTPVTYRVTVSYGMVCERDMTLGAAVNSLVPWDCPAQFDINGDPTKFTIAENEAIFVLVLEDNTGSIGDVGTAVDMVIAGKDTESTNYIPGVQSGEYYYKIAELIDDGTGKLVLVNYLAGSHIFKETGLTADFQIMSCDITPVQLARLSFLSGNLVSVNVPTATVGLFDNAYEVGVQDCCFVDDLPP